MKKKIIELLEKIIANQLVIISKQKELKCEQDEITKQLRKISYKIGV